MRHCFNASDILVSYVKTAFAFDSFTVGDYIKGSRRSGGVYGMFSCTIYNYSDQNFINYKLDQT